MHHDTRDPFLGIPGVLSAHLRPHLAAVSGDVVAAIARSVAEYGRIADPASQKRLRQAVEAACGLFVDRLTDPHALQTTADMRRMYEQIGRTEANEGRSLDTFQKALRIGTRTAWRAMLDRVDKRKVPQAVIASAAEAMLVHMTEIADAATSGYLSANVPKSRGQNSHRPDRAPDRLVSLLVADPPPSPEAVALLAREVHWPLPESIGVVALAPSTSGRPLLLPPDILVGVKRDYLVVPDPTAPSRKHTLRKVLQGRNAAVGPATSLTEGFRSLHLAQKALLLSQRGIIPAAGLVTSVEHLGTLLLFRDEGLLEMLCLRHLRPMEEVREQHRDKLAETLLVWLQSGHNANIVAARLDIHPQTVRYRMRQLHRLYGAKLLQPDVQFELQLVLRARLLRQTAGETVDMLASPYGSDRYERRSRRPRQPNTALRAGG
ncbi:PucR family transcriptional regulator [Streptomyces sp. NPDC054887]